MPHDPAPGPLAGLLVADLSTVLAGPLCTMLLGDLGAEVIKIEPPEGDMTRGWGPPWVGDAAAGTQTAAYFLSVNRNKRSLRLDLRQPDGRQVLSRLLERADVFVENLRPGALERMGFGDDALHQLNARLVHLAISGYGARGPDASRAGYDFAIQAEAGLMSITGFPDAGGGRPTKVGVAITDVITGLSAALGVLAGLLARTGQQAGERGAQEGRPRGQRIDVSILESALAALVNQAQNAFVSGRAPGRLGNAHPNIVPYETFPTADGEIVITVGNEAQWARVPGALGLPDLAADPRFATNARRVEHRTELRARLEAHLATRPAADWLAALAAADIPAAPIRDIVDAFSTPQVEALGMRTEVTHPALGRVAQVRSPFTLSETPTSIRLPPPLLGEHTDAILEELGYAPTVVRRLRNLAVV